MEMSAPRRGARFSREGAAAPVEPLSGSDSLLVGLSQASDLIAWPQRPPTEGEAWVLNGMMGGASREGWRWLPGVGGRLVELFPGASVRREPRLRSAIAPLAPRPRKS